MSDHDFEDSFLRSYARWVISHRLTVILIVLAITGFLVTRLGSLQIDSNPSLWAPQKHSYVETTNVLEEVFGGRNLTVIGIVPRHGDIYQLAVLEKIKRIQEKVEQLPNAIKHNILSLAAHKAKYIKGGPDGMEVRPMMEVVPTTPEAMAKLRAAVDAMPIYKNALVSPDGHAAAVIADFKQDANTPNFIAMMEGLHKIVDAERDDNVDIYLGGLPAVGEAADQQFMKMPLFFGAALLVIMAIQYLAFRSIQGMLLPMITGILSVIWSLGAMGLMQIHMDPLNTTTPILIMAVAAGHAIQILKRYYEEYGKLAAAGDRPRDANREAVVESVARVGPVMVVAGAIAAITFFSLAGTGIPMVQHFGVFAGCGVIVTLLLEMSLIPALRASFSPPTPRQTDGEQKAGRLDRMLGAIASTLTSGRAPSLVALGLVLIAAAAAGIIHLKVDNRFKQYHRADSQLRISDAELNKRFGGADSIQFLVQTPTADGIKDPSVLKGISKLQAFLEQQPTVGKTQSIADMIKRMNQAMHGDDPARNEIPASRELIAQYLFLYSLSGEPQDFDSLVDNDYRRATVWTYLKSDSTTNADQIAKRAREVIDTSFPPGVTVQMGGGVPQQIALNEVIVADKFRNMIQMAVVIFALGALVMRSFVGGLFVVTPLIAVIATNFGLMGWRGTSLDVSAVTTAAMAVGIGADYEIYLLYRFREELRRTGSIVEATRVSMLTSGKAILFVALSVMGGYAVLQLSDFAFYNQLSNSVVTTMAVSVCFALFFLRALMLIFKPKFVFGRNADKFFRPTSAATGEGA